MAPYPPTAREVARREGPTVRPANGLRRVELPWDEAHGVGRRDFKIKVYMDEG
jgi:hypothetical protein